MNAQGLDTRDDEPGRVPFYRNPFVLAFIVGIVTLTALRPLLRHIPDPPPVAGVVPPFALIDQDGQPFNRDALLGRVTIATLFCTRCGRESADTINGLHRIEAAYKERGIDRIGILAITSDPTADTPQKLREYADSVGAGGTRWTFATGDPAGIHDFASALFTGGPVPPREASARPVAATSGAATGAKPLILIDEQARIRGWYATDEMGLDEVYNRAQHVLAQFAPVRP